MSFREINAKSKKPFPKISVTLYVIVSNNSPPKLYCLEIYFCGKLTTGSARVQRGNFSQKRRKCRRGLISKFAFKFIRAFIETFRVLCPLKI